MYIVLICLLFIVGSEISFPVLIIKAAGIVLEVAFKRGLVGRGHFLSIFIFFG